MKVLKVLVACEESQRVCTEFRKLGHEAYSADIQEPSGNHPEYHIHGDALKVLHGGEFSTMDGVRHTVNKWDLCVCFPPCTYLTMVATRQHSLRCTPLDKINKRTMNRIEGMRFFMQFVNAECPHIAIENPIGIMNTAYRSPDQVINPYQFAKSTDDAENYVTKSTCLWLKGLPTLKTNSLPKPDNGALFGYHPTGKARNWEETRTGNRAKERSKTFPGIAHAMATQWSDYLTGNADRQLSLFEEGNQ